MQKFTFSISIWICPVCGGVFPTEEAAQNSDCYKGEKMDPSYYITQKVWAFMEVVDGMEAVGQEWGEAIITDIIPISADEENFSSPPVRLGETNQKFIAFEAIIPRPHTCSYKVEALGLPREKSGTFITTFPVPEEEIAPLMESSML